MVNIYALYINVMLNLTSNFGVDRAVRLSNQFWDWVHFLTTVKHLFINLVLSHYIKGTSCSRRHCNDGGVLILFLLTIREPIKKIGVDNVHI